MLTPAKRLMGDVRVAMIKPLQAVDYREYLAGRRTMALADIRAKLERFAKWPTDDRRKIATTTAVRFARHMMKRASEAERQLCELELATKDEVEKFGQWQRHLGRKEERDRYAVMLRDVYHMLPRRSRRVVKNALIHAINVLEHIEPADGGTP
jgi:hypothetical protein